MKKTNKKGFTLVELLAVIVILGVLLMIAVPAIQNVISKSKKSAFIDQAKLALENVETMISVTENITMSTNSSSCEIKLSDIKLDRGSWKDYAGKVTVTKLAEADENGKFYTVAIYISNGIYSINNKTTTGDNRIVDVDAEYTAATTPAETTCTWYK